MNKVMVTGSAGFIGRAVVSRLKSNNVNVVEFNLPDHDVRELYDVRSSLEGCDAVIHLAGVLGTHELFDTPYLAIDANIMGSLNVLEACKEQGAAYIGITMPQVFPSIYTATKVASTKLASAYAHSFNLRVAHVRAFNAFGPGQAHGHGHPQKIIPTFAYNITHGLPVPIWGDGSQGVDLIHTDDLADVMVRAAIHATDNLLDNDLTFDGGSGVMHTVNEVARMVAQAADVPELTITYKPMRRGEVPTHIVANAANWEVLGLRRDAFQDPAVLATRLRDTVDFYRQMP